LPTRSREQAASKTVFKVAARVEMTRLHAGDYDLGCGVVVERKSVADLHLSLQQGRLWGQLGRLRATARRPYVLVEGVHLDDGPQAAGAIRGACLGVIGQGIPLLRSTSRDDSVLWLQLLAARVHGVRIGRDRPSYAQRLKPPETLVREAMLAAVPGISVTGARALLERFGSVAAVIGAEEDELLRVPGIGQKRVGALRSAVS
jgi:Fanconi anemia group M protein